MVGQRAVGGWMDTEMGGWMDGQMGGCYMNISKQTDVESAVCQMPCH